MATNKVQKQVMEFSEKFGCVIGDTPVVRDAELRAKLVAEEAIELIEALRLGDLVGVIDGIGDLLYVSYGTAVACGINMEPFSDEIHKTNMAKESGGKRGDGKILKPKGWVPPDIEKILKSGKGNLDRGKK